MNKKQTVAPSATNPQPAEVVFYKEKISDISLFNLLRKLKTVFSCFENMTEEEMRTVQFRHQVSQRGQTFNIAATNEDLFLSFTVDWKGGEA